MRSPTRADAAWWSRRKTFARSSGVERTEVADLLAEPDESHGHLELVADPEHDAAFRRTVELGEHDARDLHRGLERLRLLDRVLSGRRVEHHPRLVRGAAQRLVGDAAHFLELVHEPDVLLLDEPTDGVDPVGRREIRDLLQAEAAQGRSILLNSHLLSEVERMCSRVAVLRSGRVAAQGRIDME